MRMRGLGFGAAWQGANYHFGHPDISRVHLELTDGLRFRLGVAAADLGEGIPETNAVILSQALGGIPLDQIDIVDPDTAVTPDGGATGASRQTAVTGNAVLNAASHMAELLKSIAAEMVDTPAGQVELRQGVLYGAGGRSLTLVEVVAEARRIGRSLLVAGVYQAPPTEPLDALGQGLGINQFSYATYVAEVEVDTDTGEVQVLRVAAFMDAGKMVRRLGAEMQVEGGTAMGLGHTLTEEFKQREGWPETDSLTTYLIPTIYDVPLEISSDFIDQPVVFGELGAKGMAELALVPVAPAIVSAIYDAVGVYVTELPATPERVLRALQASQTGESREDQ